MAERCECADPECPCCRDKAADGVCGEPATTTLYRVDMEDATGTPMCDGCAEDAMEAGVFTDEDPAYCSCGEPWDRDCMGGQRCPVCDPPCPHCSDGGMDTADDAPDSAEFFG